METSKLQTPCFVIDKADIEDGIRSFRKAMRLRFDKVVIGYSVKTNPLPFVLTLARDNGCYAEVVSYNEYNLALKVGFAPNHIIYNGCLKSRETFLRAIKSGAIVNVETWREIDWLREAAHTIMGGEELACALTSTSQRYRLPTQLIVMITAVSVSAWKVGNCKKL